MKSAISEHFIQASWEKLKQMMERFDWDGVNLAELYFESLEGAGNPARFTPMNDDVRAEFRRDAGFDPVELFDAIDSVDSFKLAERLSEAAGKLGKRLPILIEVKLSPEETKAGLDPDSLEAAQLFERVPSLEHLHIQGLMTIAPWGVAEDITRACFRSLRTLRDKWSKAHPNLSLEVLSMGMSGDFPLAIEEGATRIRIGTALFGKREKWAGAE